MIEDWRSKWFEGTDGATDKEFPFGWSQLNSDGHPRNWSIGSTTKNIPGIEDPTGEWAHGFPSIRKAQFETLNLPNTFQAVILDTPVASGSVHSPYKQSAGARLLRGALNVAYSVRT